ncbi:MAG: ABC transporter ATP-binding protein [Candidatus Fermentibacteraceae bacterium]|nr:ABC transporter ATP-binding protein [Candidatus Fermentibacteraceae bacterium]MBN2609863.1 ABC transporter ATP-binding protein [Candidatus Fermentibacteraceae bacterium]
MPALTMEGVSAGYGDQKVLEDIRLSVMPGEICGLIGPNGSGKSTLLRSVIRLGVEVRGSVSICGSSFSGLTRNQTARLVSYLPQNFNPNSHLTVFETVLLGRHPYRSGWSMDSTEDLETARKCMEETDTWELRGRVFANLSGGEKRLVMLASALAQEPRLLLLDEPGSSLDFRHQLNMWLLLKKLSGSGIAVLVSTHEVAMAGRYLDSVMVLSGGRAEAFGSPKEVFNTVILSKAFQVDLHVSHDGITDSWVVVPGVSR